MQNQLQLRQKRQQQLQQESVLSASMQQQEKEKEHLVEIIKTVSNFLSDIAREEGNNEL